MQGSGSAVLRDSVLARNNVQVRGHGDRTLVFAHGFGCDQNMWRFVAPAFESRYRIVLFDYVGCGRSDLGAFDAGRYDRLDGYAQDLLDVCDALDLQQATLIGHSVSAMIGVLAAVREPARFAELVMIGPSPRYLNDPPHYVGGFEREDLEGLLELMEHNYLGWAGALAPMVMGDTAGPGLTAELEHSFCSTDPVAARLFARATFYADNRADLARLDVPTLILQVSDDALAPVGVGEFMQRALPGSELHVLQGHGHCPHMSQPGETVAVLDDYLRRRHGGQA
ncbi:alpha/beta fold hydrolase [Caldimonas brevitalea]|uniref:Sigma factor SigB regulation protein RsbQ n=1 Tax=Caldimonas brevitalea TaxID=413882 RepID=A0A0G3BPU9_9BURK|nr:alpha/beta hydrolase [Caldimonas brevitalea]AKJ29371.1 sigma factor SigB regulation protein RsbQ [Caldimonas brevitalea]